MPDGVRLCYEQYLTQTPKAWVIIVHGWGEYSRRYLHVCEALNASGYNVVLYDHRGHGRSQGRAAYVNRFSDYSEDLARVHKTVAARTQLPVFMLAHSMGGLLAGYYFMDPSRLPVSGVVISAPYLLPSKTLSPVLKALSGLISILLPKLKTIHVDNTNLSRDPAVLAAAIKDNLHYKQGVPARTGAELLKAAQWVRDNASLFSQRVLVLHGGDDRIAQPEGSQLFFKRISSADKEIMIYPGAYHEILNETNKQEVIEDVIRWMDMRIA